MPIIGVSQDAVSIVLKTDAAAKGRLSRIARRNMVELSKQKSSLNTLGRTDSGYMAGSTPNPVVPADQKLRFPIAEQ